MDRSKKQKKLVSLLCMLYLSTIQLSAQIYFDELGYPVHENTLREQFQDTVYIHDTLIIADIDALLKISNEDLAAFAKRYEELSEMLDSLNQLSSDRLYYNYFMSLDSARRLSNRFYIKEYNIVNDDLIQSIDRTKDWDHLRDTSMIRKELLFSFDTISSVTDAFLKNKLLIRKTLSQMFTIMSENPDIVGVNLFFPHYTFKEKRAMTQFVKSVRILMDASQDFKPEKIRLNVTFLNRGKIDENFSYCLLQEAGEVLFINSSDLVDSHFVEGTRITLDNIKNIRFFPQLKNHFYIARFYPGNLDIREQNMTNFSESSIAQIMDADYPENKWELYLLILIILLLVIFAFVVLYYTYVPFSALINDNAESVLLIALVLILEIMAIIVSIFRNMCYTDSFAFMHKNPVVLFTLPLAMILVVPFLNGIAKKRRIP